jgi:hypothetical protein
MLKGIAAENSQCVTIYQPDCAVRIPQKLLTTRTAQSGVLGYPLPTPTPAPILRSNEVNR